ncbi:MAG TPA: riboflavin synthase [Candidatus Angelobacter sp.]|nr:riboflavin synthase [Candidatus Angelobacter sp.]
MFTGLIQETGQVAGFKKPAGKSAARITITVRNIPRQLKIGDSVAVSGVCLTAVSVSKKEFSADLAEETLQRTSLGRLQPGSLVNLELPAKASDRLGGHVVQGHVDGVGKLHSLEKIRGRDDWRLSVVLPQEFMRYVVPRGSITIEGISLTVARVLSAEIEVAIVPHTYQATNLHVLQPGSPVNIEVDVLAKYAEKMSHRKSSSKLTVAQLVKLGF